MQEDEFLSILPPDLQIDACKRVHFALDCLADFFACCLYIRKALKSAVIGNTKNQDAAFTVGKSTDTFQPAFGPAIFQRFLLIVFGRFTNSGTFSILLYTQELFLSTTLRNRPLSE